MHPVKTWISPSPTEVYKTLQPEEEHGIWLCASSSSSHLRIPSGMQAVRNRASPTGHGVFPGFNSEFQSDPGFSWTSTYTPRSHVVNKKARSSRSFRERVVAIARPCANCFASTRSEIKEAHEIPPTDVHDVSMSPSKPTVLFSFVNHVEADMLPV